MNLLELQADPSKFRDVLKIDADGRTVRLGAVLDDWQRDDFEALDPAWKNIVGQSTETGTNRAWLERPRGHSKTTDIAASVSYALFASKRLIRGVCAAADAEQAGLIKKAIDSMCRLNPWLNDLLDVQGSRVVNQRTGSELEIITSDSLSSYGKLVDFVVCDELTHWRTNALWVSLFSTAGKRRCVFLVITNAGYESLWQYELRQNIKVAPDWYFSRLEGPKASWITQDRLDEQRRLLPTIDFNRLWLNIWGKASGNALEEADIEAAVSLSGPITEPEKGWRYVAGLDIGLTRNASALVVLGKHVGYRIEREKRQRLPYRKRILIDAGVIDEPEPEYIGKHEPGTGKLKVAHLSIWNAVKGQTIDMEAIETQIVRINNRFQLSDLGFDPWQAAYLAQRLRKRGIRATEVPFSAPNLTSMCSVVLEHFRERNIELFAHDAMVRDLGNLKTEARSYGVRLTSPITGDGQHGDLATALAIGAHVSKKVMNDWQTTVEGELVVSP